MTCRSAVPNHPPNLPHDNQYQPHWEPRSTPIILLGIGGILMAVICLTAATDPAGQVLAAIASLGLLIFAVGSWRARPKLALTGDSLIYRGWFHTQSLHREDIDTIGITEFRRIARTVRLLEIDTHEGQLFVLSRWDLGTDPRDVLQVLIDAGYARKHAT